MRFLMLLAVLAGCKSAPVQYEMIEVVNVQAMQDMYGPTRKGRARAVPEVSQAFRLGFRSDCNLHVSFRANSKASRAVFGTDRIVPPRGSRKERTLAAGIESAVDSIRLPAVD